MVTRTLNKRILKKRAGYKRQLNMTDVMLMKMAVQEAEQAELMGEVPVGAVLVNEWGSVLSVAHNQTISRNDPTAHAEVLAIRKAGLVSRNYRLLNTTLYVTIEPCIMCMGAIIHARISRVVFGTKDPKWGAAGSLYDFPNDKRLNHHPDISGGVCVMECRSIIQEFFRKKRS